jgi:excisionase family DNA binding protein
MSTVSMEPTWISVRRYCEIYGLSRATVYKYLDSGLLESWQVGRVLRVKNEPPQESKPQRSVGRR